MHGGRTHGPPVCNVIHKGSAFPAYKGLHKTLICVLLCDRIVPESVISIRKRTSDTDLITSRKLQTDFEKIYEMWYDGVIPTLNHYEERLESEE